MDRTKRRARPTLDGLESRQLLSGARAAAEVRNLAEASSFGDQKIRYATPGGARVTVTLTGSGSLAGSSLGQDGALNLVYSGTNPGSRIIGKVSGGSGRADLASIRNANAPIDTLTGIGAEVVNIVRLPDFRLVSGGTINLLGGVNELTLDAVGSNTQIRLRDTPLNTTVESLSGSSSSGSSSGGSSSSGTIATEGVGTLDPTTRAFGGGNVSAVTGAIDFIDTVGNGQNARGTPGLSQARVSSGRSLTYAFQRNNGLRLTGVGGTFVPGENLIEPRDVSKPGPAVAPPGVVLSINRVNGAARTAATPPLGNPEVFGYDPAANALVRFDATTGAQLQAISLPVAATGTGGVALARVNGRTFALVGVGNSVLAYNATTGALAGQFTTANLAGTGLASITGIGTSGGTTVITDARNGLGVAQAINVGASLTSGQAVATGAAFIPGQQFQLAGGLTGVPGLRRLFANGSAYFDSFQPNQPLAGVLSVTPGGASLSEAERVALRPAGTTLNALPDGGIAGDPSVALGSIESNLALVTGVTPAGNVVTLFSPLTLANQGSVTLADPNPLSDLSESFHPELAGSALIDVQGNVQSVRIIAADGLVLNDSGNLNLLRVKSLRNSSVVGLPISHVNIRSRVNSSVVSSSRLIVGDRGGVTVVDGIRPYGPLFLPEA